MRRKIKLDKESQQKTVFSSYESFLDFIYRLYSNIIISELPNHMEIKRLINRLSFIVLNLIIECNSSPNTKGHWTI